MLVEYDIDEGKVWTSFPHFTISVVEHGDFVSIENETGKEIARLDTSSGGDNASRLLRGLAHLCDSQALTITRAA
jgi:hypothetical protein